MFDKTLDNFWFLCHDYRLNDKGEEIVNRMLKEAMKRDYDFDISDSDKERIIEGYDDIGLSLMHKNKIEQYEKKMKL